MTTLSKLRTQDHRERGSMIVELVVLLPVIILAIFAQSLWG